MRIYFLAIPFIIIISLWPLSTLAQDNEISPVEVELTVNRSTLNKGDSTQAILILRNTRPYTMTDVGVQYQGNSFLVTNSKDLPNLVSPYTSVQSEYTLNGQVIGSHNIIFTVEYSWNDPDVGRKQHRIETLSIEKVTITGFSGINWPDYIIPLLIGFIISQFGTWFTNQYKQHIEDAKLEEQAKSITLAFLQASRRAVDKGEDVSLEMWDEAIVKGNLYPSLHKLSISSRDPDLLNLSKRLSELSVDIEHYNRLNKPPTPPKLEQHLKKELGKLINFIEKLN